MREDKITLATLPSGTIDLLYNGYCQVLQFNTTCMDALPYCKGMCCRLRLGYSVELEKDEEGKYLSRPHPTQPLVQILQAKESDYSCVYLDEKSMCSINDTKPRMCKQWHCSPGGEPGDESITRRDAGWMLTPMRLEELQAQASLDKMRTKTCD